MSKLNEAGREISTANAGAIKTALQSAFRAFVPLMKLIGMPTTEALPADDDEASAEIVEADRRLQEARNVAEWFEASIHRDFTMTADGMFGDGRLTRDERIALSGAIGNALDAFRSTLTDAAPGLYQRDPYRMPEDTVVMDEADTQDLDTTELIPLQEAAIGQDGTALIKLIQPGWGSSGFYPAGVLRRDGPQVFTAGTKMFWNHPTRTEEAERPEGSLNDLASELIEDARYLDDGPRGAGLYAKAKIFGPYREAIGELAPYIGTSIRAAGKARAGEAEGRTGSIIHQIVAAQSVDYVTTPGAGGEIVALFEAARTQSEPPVVQEVPMPEEVTLSETMTAFRGLQQQNEQLQHELMLQRATSERDRQIAALGLPEAIAARVRESVGAAAPTVEGQPLTLDTAAFTKIIESAANREILYAQTLAPSGVITGMGGGSGGWNPNRQEPTPEQIQQRQAGLFQRIGLSEAAAKDASQRH